MARDPGLNTWTSAASVLDDRPVVDAPYDALAHPANNDLIGAGLSMLPQGPAWGSPDGEALSLTSLLARLVRVLLAPFEVLYARAYKLARESSVSGVDELLPEWEAEYGLPDNCVTGETSIAERLRALEAKVMAIAIITPGDFIRLAAGYGFEIEIEEPACFECGFSECGGEHTCGDLRQETYWIVYLADPQFDYFRAGESEVGHDPLFSLGNAERLLCILRRLAPAWTTPLLALDALRPPGDPPEGDWIYLDEAMPRQYLTVDGDYIYLAP